MREGRCNPETLGCQAYTCVGMFGPSDQACPRKRGHGTAQVLLILALSFACNSAVQGNSDSILTLNTKDTGYRGVWYMNQPLPTEYRFKYSGGMATFCAKHSPFAVYCDKVKKTFFCYGGTAEDSYLRHDLTTTSDKDASGVLLHMVSCYDHTTGQVPRRPVNAHDGFYAFWAEGHGRQPSASALHFCTKAGDVFRLPVHMTGEFATPEKRD
jgi:hypothetical protein